MVLFCHDLPGKMFVALAWLPLGTWSLWAAPTGKDMLTIATIINQSRFQHFTSDITPALITLAQSGKCPGSGGKLWQNRVEQLGTPCICIF